MKSIKVLQVFSVLSMGGAERWLMEILRFSKDRAAELPVRVETDVLLTGGRESHFDEEARSLGARLYYIPFRRGHLTQFAIEFRDILRRNRYDAIHDHQFEVAGLHFIGGAGRLPPIRVVHLHNPIQLHVANYRKGPTRQVIGALGRAGLRRFATHIAGTSNQILIDYGVNKSAYPRQKLGPAYCGIDTGSFLGNAAEAHASVSSEFGWGNTDKIVLFVGRLDVGPSGLQQKNPLFALEVFRELVRLRPLARLLVAGEGGAALSEFIELIRSWNLQSSVKFIGVRNDVPQLMLGSDLLLFPSIAEGLGMVAVEAQAAGLPVLASESVPREASIGGLPVEYLALAEGPRRWAIEAERMLNMPRPLVSESNEVVRQSPFHIAQSVRALVRLYVQGAL